MKKVLSVVFVLFALFALGSCSNEKAVFKVGKDTGAYAPAELSGYEVDRTVFIEISGPDNVIIFSGKVTVKSANPTFYEAFLAACTGKGIAQTSSADSGWIQTVDSYENGTNDMYWLGYLNGENLLVGTGSTQIRDNDYLQLKFEGFSF